jgi:hypothetical protein
MKSQCSFSLALLVLSVLSYDAIGTAEGLDKLRATALLKKSTSDLHVNYSAEWLKVADIEPEHVASSFLASSATNTIEANEAKNNAARQMQIDAQAIQQRQLKAQEQALAVKIQQAQVEQARQSLEAAVAAQTRIINAEAEEDKKEEDSKTNLVKVQEEKTQEEKEKEEKRENAKRRIQAAHVRVAALEKVYRSGSPSVSYSLALFISLFLLAMV